MKHLPFQSSPRRQHNHYQNISDTACIGFPKTAEVEAQPLDQPWTAGLHEQRDRHLSRGRRRRGRVEITVAAAPQTPAADRCRRYVWAKKSRRQRPKEAALPSRAQFFSCLSFLPSVRSAKYCGNRSGKRGGVVLVPQSASHWQFARFAATVALLTSSGTKYILLLSR